MKQKSTSQIAKSILKEIRAMSNEEIKKMVANAPPSEFGKAIMMMDPAYYGQVTGINDELEEDHF